MTKFESSDVFIVFSNFVIKKISTTIVRGKFYRIMSTANTEFPS